MRDYYRDSYRITKNTFWAWVAVSFAIGLAIGLAFYAFRAASVNKQVDAAKKAAATQVQQSQAAAATLQTQLSAAEASVTALTAQVNAKPAPTPATPSSSSSSNTSTATLTVVSRTISPSTVATDGSITMTAKVKGSPDRVTMRITGKSVSFDQTYNLTKVSTSGSTQTWRRTVSAPSKKGTYAYYATAYKNGKSATMPGASPSTLTVK